MTLFDTLFTALRGVTANKLRAARTTLGVIIGVASVIVMLALGNGARAAVEANFRFLGSNRFRSAPGKNWTTANSCQPARSSPTRTAC